MQLKTRKQSPFWQSRKKPRWFINTAYKFNETVETKSKSAKQLLKLLYNNSKKCAKNSKKVVVNWN